jgi:hypothetical protein
MLHSEIHQKIIRCRPGWGKNPTHEANQYHLGYGDLQISLLMLHKPPRILAIGSQYGYIPAILGMAAQSYGGTVDFVDANYDREIVGKLAFGGVGYWTAEHQQEFIAAFGLNGTMRFHIETTKAFFEKNQTQYQYAYIDGNHSYEGVRFDLEQIMKCCAPGALIVLHDANVDDGWSGYGFGVKQAIESLGLPHVVFGSFPGLAVIRHV